MAAPTKEETKRVYAQAHKDSGRHSAWLDIDFSQWWKAETREVCRLKVLGKQPHRCSAPCEFCKDKIE